jgi:hypothetical protein
MMGDTQADLTERARASFTFEYMSHTPIEQRIKDVAAALQSEREAAAAEARKIIRDLVENFGAGGPKANKAFAVATRYLLASPAPQEETR